jgi:hypothetical protein
MDLRFISNFRSIVHGKLAQYRNRHILHSLIGELRIVNVSLLILLSLSPLQLFFGLFLAFKLFLKLDETMFTALCHDPPLFKLCAR